jgi:hypothetical protein
MSGVVDFDDIPFEERMPDDAFDAALELQRAHIESRAPAGRNAQAADAQAHALDEAHALAPAAARVDAFAGGLQAERRGTPLIDYAAGRGGVEDEGFPRGPGHAQGHASAGEALPQGVTPARQAAGDGALGQSE